LGRFASLQIATYGLQNTTFWMTPNETPIVEEHLGDHQRIHGSSLHIVQILQVAEVVEFVHFKNGLAIQKALSLAV